MIISKEEKKYDYDINAVHIYGRSLEYFKGNGNGKKGEPVKFEPQLSLRTDI